MADVAFARPGAILFACTLNRVRSPMAAALLSRRLDGDAYVDSCGVLPTGQIDPFAIAALEEIGIDLRGHRPKSFADLHDGSFDLVISLTEEAHRAALDFTRHLAAEVEFWPTDDPTIEGGSRSQRLDAYRRVRDGLIRRLDARFATRSTPSG